MSNMQLDFPQDRLRAQIGQKLDATSAIMVSSHSLQTIPFGTLVVYDDDDPLLCKLPQANKPIAKPLGISLRHHYGEDYQPKNSIAILRQGRVWVLAEKVSAPGDSVYIKFLDDGLTQFTGDSKDTLPLGGAIFLEKCASGLVPLEIDFMGGVL